MRFNYGKCSGSNNPALEIKRIRSIRICLIDYPGYLFDHDEMFERGLRDVHACVGVDACDGLGWQKEFVFMMQLTSDDQSSEIVEPFPHSPELSMSAEFVALGLDRTAEFLGFRSHAARVILDEMRSPGKYNKHADRIPPYQPVPVRRGPRLRSDLRLPASGNG